MIRKLLAILVALVPAAALADEPVSTDPDYSIGAKARVAADAGAASTKLVSESLARQFAELQRAYERKQVAKAVAEASVKLAASMPTQSELMAAAFWSRQARRPVLYAVAK